MRFVDNPEGAQIAPLCFLCCGREKMLRQSKFASGGQGRCPWNPLGEIISPRPPQRGMCNFMVKMFQGCIFNLYYT